MKNVIFKQMMMFTLLFVAGWTIAQAQQTDPAQRIGLTLEDNRSVYTTVGERNLYENDLRLNQPTGAYQLTAGMLNEGDNHIIFHRIDDQGIDTEFARINLSATKTENDYTYLDGLDFYGDGTSAPSSNIYITQADLASISPNWGTSADGQGLVWQTNGCAYINAVDGLTYTIPDGYSNAKIMMSILVGPDASGGYWAASINGGGWSLVARATTGYVSECVFTGMNSGDVIRLLGADGSSLTYSPDIAWIEFISLPDAYVPTIEVTPTISYKDGENWGTEAALGTSTTYQPNNIVDLYGLGTVTDAFYAETDQNAHSDYYNYKVTFGGNINLPASGSTGLDFYSSADFSACTTSNPASAAMTGYNGWTFNFSNAYSSGGIISCYIEYYGDIIFTMPDNFMGNSVNVTVTSSTGSDGAGILYVNDVLHTFTAGETYTWTVPVTANGTIEFKSDGQTYSVDISRIVISSGNGNALNAPSQNNDTKKANLSNRRSDKYDHVKSIANNQKERIINVTTLNDKKSILK